MSIAGRRAWWVEMLHRDAANPGDATGFARGVCWGGVCLGSLWEGSRRKGLISFFFFHKNDLLSAFCLALLSRFSSVASTELEESIGR